MDKRRSWMAALYIAPTAVLLGVFLLYPAISTVYASFFNEDSSQFVGVQNYVYLFTNRDTLIVFRNNLYWLVIFTSGVIVLGLLLAVLANQVRYEAVAKAIIFIPMAVSFTAAAVIWRFMYVYQAPELEQIGVLNAVLKAIGLQPVPWLTDLSVNNFALIVAGIWIWTGFTLVVISAGLKGIPTDVIEAARVDGATEFQIFRHVLLPMLAPVLVVVAVTMVINSFKVFDLVYVMTAGNYDTDVLANRMFREMFTFGDFGRASAVAVVLLLAIVPMMLVNLRRFRREQA